MVPNDDHSNRWNQAQKVLAWVEIGIQFIIQILIIHQWARYTPEEAINLIRIEHSLKDEDEDYVIRLPEGLLNPQFRFLFTLLTFGLGITHGYANMKVQKSLNEDHFQLLIYSCICFCNWQEAKVFLGKYDIIIGGFSYLLCALIDFDNYSRQEVFFIFLSFALFMCTYIYTFLFQSYGMTFTDNEGKNGVEAQKTPQSQVNNNLLSSGDENQNKKLIQNSNFNIDKQQSSKRIMFFQFPFSQSINQNNINLKRPSQFTFDPQISASRRTIGNGTYAYVMNSEMVLDTKMSRILNSVNPNVSVPKFSAIQENINQHLLFYQGMIDKLDSAIFVIGGPNQVFEALNVKASSFFTPYFISIGEDSSNNFKKVFESITLKDYNKSCYQYLESLGISRVELPTCSSPKVFTKKGTLNNFFNSQTPNLQNQRTKSPSLHQNQNLKQSLAYQNSFNFNKQHTVQSQEGYDESIRKQTSNDPKKLQRNQTTISSFPDISLLGLLEKLLACKKLDSQSECIEIIDFQTTKELQNILQYVQIKVYGYQLNGEEFLFVSFAKNQEREEIMRQKIHKDIEYSTFKTISHELGTYINFMLLILEGIFLNILIEISKYNNTHQIMLYYSNFSKIGAMIDKSIPQKCKDDYFNVIYSFFYIQLLPHLFLTRELKRINFKYFKCQKLNLLIKNNEIIILIILGNKVLIYSKIFYQKIRIYTIMLNSQVALFKILETIIAIQIRTQKFKLNLLKQELLF